MFQLAELQAWLQAQLTGGAGSNSTPVTLEEIIRDNGFDPSQRLRVYTSGYFLRLLECLRGDFPLLRGFLSDEVFGVFARGYIYSVGSHSYSLLDFSKNFPDFLLRMTPSTNSEEEWRRYRFPYELAVFERLLIEVATDKGFENEETAHQQTPATNSIWAGFSDEGQLKAPPCLRLMEAHFDLCAFMNAPQPVEQRPIPDVQLTYIALYRRQFHLQKIILEPWQYYFLKYIKEGQTPSHTVLLEQTAMSAQKQAGELRADLLFFLPFCETQQLLRRI